jgi:streptogramin lyase
VQEWDPPVFAPRRARFDAAGGFWIPGYADGKIARLDTKTMKYDIVKVPALASDEVEAPYAVAVEPKSQDLWVTTNMSDRMFRYTPSTKTWASFPMPTRGVITRDIVFSPDGRVCGVNNPWGIPTPGLVEGNMDSLLCLTPDVRKSTL